MSANEIAEAALIVIKRLAKWIAWGTLGLVGIGFVGWGVNWLYEYVTYERPKSEVRLEVFRKDEVCDSQFPVLVGVQNGSSKTILKYSFTLAAKEPGRSTNLAHWESYEDDQIIKPGEGKGTCWRVRERNSTYGSEKWITDPKVEISISSYHLTFE